MDYFHMQKRKIRIYYQNLILLQSQMEMKMKMERDYC